MNTKYMIIVEVTNNYEMILYENTLIQVEWKNYSYSKQR
jgi:hypothetical protein